MNKEVVLREAGTRLETIRSDIIRTFILNDMESLWRDLNRGFKKIDLSIIDFLYQNLFDNDCLTFSVAKLPVNIKFTTEECLVAHIILYFFPNI